MLTANELAEDRLVCEGFSYPEILNVLTPYEWACIAALTSGYARSQANSMQSPSSSASSMETPAEVRASNLDRLRRGQR
ncbi:MAG TPA: hypothetical protein VIC84_06830 [Blastocatellia bacterium]